MFRTLTRTQLITDIVVAVALLLVSTPFFLTDSAGLLGLLVLVILLGAFAVRNLSPGLGLIIAWVGAIVQMLFLLEPGPANLAIFAVLYATARHGTELVKWLGFASTIVGAVVAAGYLAVRNLFQFSDCRFYQGAPCLNADSLPGVLQSAALMSVLIFGVLALAWMIGQLMRVRRASLEAEEARILEERRRLDQQQIVHHLEERNRIARDMHDVVAHSLAVVIAQADGARYSITANPDAASAALRTISSTARDALGDVRVLLAQLRHEAGDAPQPGLADLEKLLEQVRLSGLTVALVEEGEPVSLGTGAQLAVYRILQEALTNALRHGDTEHPALVTLRWGESELGVEVRNRTVPAEASETPWSAGYGTAGMQERALLAGGQLTVRREGTEYVVTGRVPSAAEAPA